MSPIPTQFPSKDRRKKTQARDCVLAYEKEHNDGDALHCSRTGFKPIIVDDDNFRGLELSENVERYYFNDGSEIRFETRGGRFTSEFFAIINPRRCDVKVDK